MARSGSERETRRALIGRRQRSQDVHDRLIHRVYTRPEHEGGLLTTPVDVRDAYVKGEVVPHLHIRRRAVEFECQEGCLVFDVPNSNVNCALLPGDQAGKVRFARCRDGCDDSEAAVLVGVVEFLKPAERSQNELIRSVVRLQTLDSCLGRAAKGPDMPFRLGSPRGVRRDGKYQGPLTGGRVGSAFSDADGVDTVVESAAETVDAIPDDQTPAAGGQRVDELDVEAILGGVRVRLGPDTVGLRVEEGIHLPSHTLEVVLRPVELLKSTR